MVDDYADFEHYMLYLDWLEDVLSGPAQVNGMELLLNLLETRILNRLGVIRFGR